MEIKKPVKPPSKKSKGKKTEIVKPTKKKKDGEFSSNYVSKSRREGGPWRHNGGPKVES